jgi:hypothetical protein
MEMCFKVLVASQLFFRAFHFNSVLNSVLFQSCDLYTKYYCNFKRRTIKCTAANYLRIGLFHSKLVILGNENYQ